MHSLLIMNNNNCMDIFTPITCLRIVNNLTYYIIDTYIAYAMEKYIVPEYTMLLYETGRRRHCAEVGVFKVEIDKLIITSFMFL